MGRAPCCDKGKVKKGPWSPEEDATLKTYLEKHGTSGNWIALPHKAGLKRCGKSCRLRWLNYLRPDIKHGGFTDEEDSVILTLYSNIGSRWSIIASQLPGRTDNDVKNYWNTKLKKKLNHNSNNNIINNDHITSCSVPKIGDSDSNYSGTSLQDNIVMDVDYHGQNQNYINFGPHNEEKNYFDQAIIGQISSYNHSVSDINIGIKGNYPNTSSNVSQLSTTTDLSSSSSNLGLYDDNSFATWINGNDNNNFISSYYGGVESDQGNGIFMEYMGFDSRNDDALLSDFGF